MLHVGRDRIAVDQVLAVARGELTVALDPDPGFRTQLHRAREVRRDLLPLGPDLPA
jgi:hypothetical protein